MRATGLPLAEVEQWTTAEQMIWLRAAALAEMQRRDLLPDENTNVLKEIAPWLIPR